MQFSRQIWKEAPFIRLLLPFVIGDLVSHNRQLSARYLLWALAITSVAIFVLNIPASYTRFKTRWLSGVLINFGLFLLGCLISHSSDIRNRDDWIGHANPSKEKIIIRIDEPLIERPKTFKSTGSIVATIEGNRQRVASGKLIVYFLKTAAVDMPPMGATLVIPAKLDRIKNFGDFDYEGYCALQNIYHQIFLRQNTYHIISKKESWSFKSHLIKIQVGIVTLFEQTVGGKEAGLAEALLIGYKNNLDRSVLQEYSDSGIIHVVAISGMHLGLIYWLLSIIISIKDWKKSSWIKPLIILVFLWLFTLVAGASASVVRSAVMFSFLLAGEAFNRKASVYNTLAGSAFFLLCFNPFWLWDLGFQLSYLAVLSIVIFMKPIYDLVYVKNKILDPLWKMIATCLAAQILTTPLTIFYFQRFPLYFLITNIVAIPLSSLIVLAEVVLCMAAPVPLLPDVLGKTINWLIALMNEFVVFMNTIPYGIIKTGAPDKISLLLIYMGIAFIWHWLRSAKAAGFILLLVLLNAYFLINL
ncbi:MAG: ComEC/Rec2 family competence protein [Chitinophagaceae bacterium]